MNNETFVVEIYNNTINDVLVGVKPEYHDELRQSYMKYLKDMYLSFDLKNANRDINKVLALIINLEKSTLDFLGVNAKLNRLLEDKALNDIISISNEGYKYAKNRIEKNFGLNDISSFSPVIDKEEAKKNIDLLNNYFREVREFNKETARQYISEGILDFQYASGDIDVTSLRIGRMIR